MPELAGGAELVAAVQVEDILDVMADDGVEGEVFDVGRRIWRSDAGAAGFVAQWGERGRRGG